jgi:hypothetical protein
MPEYNRSCEVRTRRHNLGMLRKVHPMPRTLPHRPKSSFPLQEEPRGRTPRRRHQSDQFHGAVPYHYRKPWRESPEVTTESDPFSRCLLRFSVGYRFRQGAWEKHLRAERNRKADIHIDNTDDKRPTLQDNKSACLSVAWKLACISAI